MWERTEVLRRSKIIWLAALATVAGDVLLPAQQKPKKKGYTYAVPFDAIPPAPALAAEDALDTFSLHEDFQLTLAASDPQLQSPVALRFDGDGRRSARSQSAS